MARYNKDIVKRICGLIKEDSYTISEICKIVNIAESTFYDWKSKKTEFSDAIKKAEDAFNNQIAVEAKRSLVKLIKGQKIEEVKKTTVDTGKKDKNGKPIVKIKEYTVTEKYYLPNTAAVIFALTNRDPDNWKNRQNTEISGDIGFKSQLESMTDEELQHIIDGKK